MTMKTGFSPPSLSTGEPACDTVVLLLQHSGANSQNDVHGVPTEAGLGHLLHTW